MTKLRESGYLDIRVQETRISEYQRLVATCYSDNLITAA
jgi:hypothetical protein